MKNRSLILIVSVICLLLAVSCSPSVNVIKGSLERVEFSAPGTLGYDGKSYALLNHEYEKGEYKVYAYYSTGYKEDVTSLASVKGGDYVTVSAAGGLTFSGEYPYVHEFTVTVSYGEKTTVAVAYAYNPGDAIGGLEKKQTSFFEGAKLTTSIAGITYLSQSGSFVSSTFLSSDGYVAIYNENDNEVTVSKLGEARALKEGDVTLYYWTYEDSEPSYFEISVVSKSGINTMTLGMLPVYPKSGETYDASSFVKTYMKNYRVQLSNSDKTVKSTVYVTDSEGKVSSDFKLSVTAERDGSSLKTGDTFKKGDKITVSVTYNGTLTAKKTYTLY